MSANAPLSPKWTPEGASVLDEPLSEAHPASQRTVSGAEQGFSPREELMATTPTKKPNALQQPMTPSADLEAVIGKGQVTRGEMVSKVWDYIKKNNLQNPANKREILADANLKKIFGTDKCSMFEMNKHLSKHVK
jgi:chromatin remodeling complex protein RSC6